MAARNPQTQAKRARELAVRERRDRKRAKKAEATAARAAGQETAAEITPQTELEKQARPAEALEAGQGLHAERP
jgi:hypothetical protein